MQVEVATNQRIDRRETTRFVVATAAMIYRVAQDERLKMFHTRLLVAMHFCPSHVMSRPRPRYPLWFEILFPRIFAIALAFAAGMSTTLIADQSQEDLQSELGEGLSDEEMPELSAEDLALLQQYAAIDWQSGPVKVALGGIASIDLPSGYSFTAAAGAQDLLELYGNPRNSAVLGAIVPESEDEDWTIIFQFKDIGYVDDSDRDDLDAEELISAFRAGIEPSNAQRRAMGAEEMRSMNWAEKPFYDPETNNLTWALDVAFPSGNSINYDIRLLGRRGVMEVTLVGDPETYTSAVPKAKQILAGYSFNAGSQYAEWKQGDKMAAVGLTGLVAGGVAIAAAKTGLLAKLGLLLAKGGKVIALVVIGLVAGLGSFVKKLFGGGGEAA